MNKYQGYLLVSDLDGTLIDSKQNISELNIDAIDYFMREGGLFAVATGRTELNVLPYIRNVRTNCPSILYNGGAIYDLNRGKYIESTILEKTHLVEPLKDILKEHKDLCMQIFTPGKMFIVNQNNIIDPVVLREKQPYETACIDDIKGENWIKIMLCDTNESLKEAERFLSRVIPDGTIHSTFSCPTYFEIFEEGVSKGSALKSLIKIMGVEREKVLAIGDYCNDIEMIKAAGLGAATFNAHPLLKVHAKAITASNDGHSLYDLINRILPEYDSVLCSKIIV